MTSPGSNGRQHVARRRRARPTRPGAPRESVTARPACQPPRRRPRRRAACSARPEPASRHPPASKPADGGAARGRRPGLDHSSGRRPGARADRVAGARRARSAPVAGRATPGRAPGGSRRARRVQLPRTPDLGSRHSPRRTARYGISAISYSPGRGSPQREDGLGVDAAQRPQVVAQPEPAAPRCRGRRWARRSPAGPSGLPAGRWIGRTRAAPTWSGRAGGGSRPRRPRPGCGSPRSAR